MQYRGGRQAIADIGNGNSHAVALIVNGSSSCAQRLQRCNIKHNSVHLAIFDKETGNETFVGSAVQLDCYKCGPASQNPTNTPFT